MRTFKKCNKVHLKKCNKTNSLLDTVSIIIHDEKLISLKQLKLSDFIRNEISYTHDETLLLSREKLDTESTP